MEARELLVTGAVQGVGFRPFAYRLAHELSLGGLVRNDARGVFIRITGPATALETFVTRIRRDAAPPIGATGEQLGNQKDDDDTH